VTQSRARFVFALMHSGDNYHKLGAHRDLEARNTFRVAAVAELLDCEYS